jgi:small neutral amino acid transporter SnatA (MarC family)
MNSNWGILIGMMLGAVFIALVWAMESWKASSRLMRGVRHREQQVNLEIIGVVIVVIAAYLLVEAQKENRRPRAFARSRSNPKIRKG